MSGILKLNLKDVGKGLVVVVLAALLEGLQVLLKGKGVDVSLSDFSPILNNLVNVGVAYLLKNLFSDESGKFLGRIG